jgi:predicted AAA+ superfamily ATPase
MIARFAQQQLADLLARYPAVALLGPRQAGKTTVGLAEMARRGDALYLDLELPSTQRQLDDPAAFLLAQRHRLVILDEVQRRPDVFSVLGEVMDARCRDGEAAGQFLLLGSASGGLVNQPSLAGQVAQLDLPPIQARELLLSSAASPDLNPLWVRGGFPLAWLAPDDRVSLRWREAYIADYLERDIPALGPRIPAAILLRLWTMLAHAQGGLLNQSQLAASLAVSNQTVARYIELLCELMLVRRLPAWHGDGGKRLVRAPKLFLRDSGLVHALLGLPDLESVLAHPVAGASWEGFVIEQLLNAAPQVHASFYRTSHGAEADLVLSFAGRETWVVEIKRASSPSPSKGFLLAAADLSAQRKLLVAPVAAPHLMHGGVEVMNPLAASVLLAGRS